MSKKVKKSAIIIIDKNKGELRKMDERIKELIEKLKKDPGLFGSNIYKNILCIENIKSNFNEEDLKRLYIAYALISSKKGINLEDFNKSIETLMKSPKLDNAVVNFKNIYEKEEWLQIEQQSQENYPYKLYMSIDNSDLCYVAIKFMQECLKRNRYDFSFKISLKESVNRRDNLVIYCTEENLQFYYNILKLSSYKARVNGPHLLGYNLGNNIYGGNDFENGTVSYSDKICDEFYRQLCNSVSPENIAINFYSNLYNDDMIKIIENGTLKQNKNK